MDKIYSNSQLVSEIIPELFLSLCGIILFLILRFLGKKLIKKIINTKILKAKHPILVFLSRAIETFLWLAISLSLLGIWGVDVSSIIAGLGLTGFVLGFALKDVLSSAVAGMLIIFYRPFKIKSKISVMGVEGIVTSVDMRYITIEDENSIHLIPNSKLISEKVTIIK